MDHPLDDAVGAWQADPDTAARVAWIEDTPARAAVHADLDPPPPAPVAAALATRGIHRLYHHQAEAIVAVRAGRHTVVVAGTASGKSLCYQVPVAETIAADAATTAFAVFPTKALTRDQERGFSRLGVDDLVAATYDGDTDRDMRRWIRDNAGVVLTNPDMLHIGILPHHARWSRFLAGLRFVVIDELHMLRGVFGSHVAHVLRRLRRIAAHYGSAPTFVFTSATIGNPGELAAHLAGAPVQVVDRDDSPAGPRRVVLWNPPVDPEDPDRRSSPLGETIDVFVDLLRRDVPTIAFSRSRKATELVYRRARERLDPERAARIAAYRGGYLAADRRRVEQGLFGGDLLGVAATEALELGIDVGGLDAAVINTFPGTIASFRQQSGRAGRQERDSLTVLVAGRDALDQFYMRHPADLFARKPESAVVNPANPNIVDDHLGCAAYELPVTPADRRFLGPEIEEAAARLASDGRLRLRDGKLFWARRRAPAPGVGIRSSGGPPYLIADLVSGDLLGSVDENRAYSQAHPGAVYLHQGDTYLIERFDPEAREIGARRAEVPWYTEPKEEKDLAVMRIEAKDRVGEFPARLGVVEVESHVVGFRRKEIGTGRVLDLVPLDLPPVRLTTRAFWFEIPDHLYAAARVDWRDVPGTLHAAEHTAIAMLPLFAICDRWDVGGLSTAAHPDTGRGVFFVYDGYDGGAGIADIGHREGARLLAATLDAVRTCPCRDGCPSCVQSPKCGNFNDPLDKHGAARLLEAGLS